MRLMCIHSTFLTGVDNPEKANRTQFSQAEVDAFAFTSSMMVRSTKHAEMLGQQGKP